MSTTIDIDVRGRATTDMQRLAAAVESSDIDDVVGAAGAGAVQRHLVALDSSRPNRLGGRRTHWYSGAAAMTTYRRVPGGAMVAITQAGIRTRILGTGVLPGGAIKPVTAKHLALPAISEAYGKSPREFSDLVPIYRRVDGKVAAVALAQAEQTPINTKRRRKDGSVARGRVVGGRVFYWLVDQVVQEPDPTVVPTEDQIRSAAYEALDQYFASVRGGISGV